MYKAPFKVLFLEVKIIRNNIMLLIINIPFGAYFCHKAYIVYSWTYFKAWLAFLYTNNKISEKEVRKTILFTILGQKYLGTTLTKKVKDFGYKNIDERS